MSGLDVLYRELLLSHSKSPRHFGALPEASHRARAENALCGDGYEVYLNVSDDRIVAIGFEGAGCAISMASASLMAVHANGRTRAEVEALSTRFGRLVSGESGDEGDIGELAAFAGVRRFPVRIECARLPWNILLAALGREQS
jgi:SUF system NifU family Fe-S assembly protein